MSDKIKNNEKYISVFFEYGAYPLWVHYGNEPGELNDNPDEWENDCEEMTNLFWEVSDIYSSFFVDDDSGFYYKGCPDIETKNKLIELFNKAYNMLLEKNNGEYRIENQVDFDKVELESEIKMAEDEKKKPHIEVILEYDSYPLWVVGDDGIYRNNNPKEWKDDCKEMTKLFWKVSNIYSSFYVEDYRGFYYKGCPNIKTKNRLIELFNKAYNMLLEKNNGKYPIDNQVNFDDIELDDENENS